MKHVWFGTGLMGAAFVERLVSCGKEVGAWNRTLEKATALEPLGVTVYADAAEAAAAADMLHVMLPDDAAVDALLERIEGATGPDAIVVDHSTVAPVPTRARFARLEARGIAFLHAPVMAAPPAARQGTGLMIVSGASDTFGRAHEELGAMAADVWYLGEAPEKAAAMKLFGNETLMFVIVGLADGFALARSGGLSATEAMELFAHFKPQGALEFRGKKMAAADFEPFFELTMARKDVRLMLETAEAAQTPLHVLPAIAARMDDLIARGYGSRDMSVLGVDAAAS